ncbi:hypothetical protein RclHR1_19420003 [Rhizophagus clarus]|uniref:Kinase-like domain-containing protein n=1 Tax=Rhizophagus clarus TaxID=94130 RepID=A0A2Z6QNN1_9GLOM|nr:hypothetical protein RclHR1_19420003 [Rhizophagus clarus]GET04645.1 kinase-like domain-containing protein [Rhizophagus clarus]
MSDNKKTHYIKNTNGWINWVEESIVKEHLSYYEYNQFSDIQVIGAGVLGKVYRANYKNLKKQFALKSFFNLNNNTVKEIVREIKIWRKIDFRGNIIRCHGITKFESENHLSNNYTLVMEYADGGDLRSYLKTNFSKLTWNDKLNMAYQLADAVLCLHNEGIFHRNLHPGNILVHQNKIKLADFGISRRIRASSNFQSESLGMIPYVDPKIFNRRKDNNGKTYSLNKKSDIYSIGVLLWEISSGRPPFCTEGEHYNIGLALEIAQGFRETVAPDTPQEYVKIYTKCWDGEPNNRPTIYQVVGWLKTMIARTKNPQLSNDKNYSIRLSELQGELSQLIYNFGETDIKDNETIIVSDKQEKLLSEKDFIKIVDEINDFIFKLLNKGIVGELVKVRVIKYCENYNINSQVIYNWLLNNQNNLNSIFLLGYFNYLGIETIKNNKKAFNLFIKASKKNHLLAQCYVGDCYFYGYGTSKNEKLAFEYLEKVAYKEFTFGQVFIGYFYENGIGIKKNLKMAFYWYEKAVNNGSIIAMLNLGNYYRDGIVVKRNYVRAFELYKQSAKEGDLDGITMLAYCYSNGIGTNINKQKALELYQKSAYLGNMVAQYNLGNMYEKGEGIMKSINKAIYWYKISAKQKYQDAQNRLEKLQKISIIYK